MNNNESEPNCPWCDKQVKINVMKHANGFKFHPVCSMEYYRSKFIALCMGNRFGWTQEMIRDHYEQQ